MSWGIHRTGYTIWRSCSTSIDAQKWNIVARTQHCHTRLEEEAFECPGTAPSFPPHRPFSPPSSAVPRGTVNDTIVTRAGQEIPIDLTANGRGGAQVGSMRYFSVVRIADSVDSKRAFDGVSFVGRVRPPRSTVLISPNLTVGIVIASVVIIEDPNVAENFVMRRVGAHFFGVGGTGVDNGCNQRAADNGCTRSDVDGCGIRLFTAGRAAEIQSGCWLDPARSVSTVIVRGDHPGCIEARAGFNGICEYDGKISFVRMAGVGLVAWHLFTRANLKPHGGGRFVQVASASSAQGPYSAFQPIQIDGYDESGPGNVYFAAVDNNPLDNETMLGLFPVNLGFEGEGNGDGESFIALSISCDGVHWSRLTKLVWSIGRFGRTWDQPVDGVVLHGDNVYILVTIGIQTLTLHALAAAM